jgi:TM2 domain-containing membrane protein YozV
MLATVGYATAETQIRAGIAREHQIEKHGLAAKSTCAPARTRKHLSMAGQGSTGNVIAALCSFFIPGLGQLIQGRLLMAIIMFVLAGVLWLVLLGWLIHLWSIIDAAMFRPKL